MIGRTPPRNQKGSEERKTNEQSHSPEESEYLSRKQRLLQKNPYWDTSAIEAIRSKLPEEQKVTRSKVHQVGSENRRTSPIRTRSSPPNSQQQQPIVTPVGTAVAFTIENTPVSTKSVRRSPRLQQSVSERTSLNETITVAKEVEETQELPPKFPLVGEDSITIVDERESTCVTENTRKVFEDTRKVSENTRKVSEKPAI